MYNPLDEVHDWILENDKDKPSSLDFQSDLISKVAKEIASMTKGKRILVTARTLHDQKTAFLRPTYSYPKEVSLYFKNSKLQKPFTYTKPPFETGCACKISNPSSKIQLEGGVYKISNTQRGGDPFLASSDLDDVPFSKRISNLLQTLEEGEWYKNGYARYSTRRKEQFVKAAIKMKRLSKSINVDNTLCFVFGRTLKNRFKQKRFQHFLAIYIKYDNTSLDSAISMAKEKNDEIWKLIRATFQAIDIIRADDEKTFRGDGLQLVSELVPIFQNHLISPADKMGYLISRIEDLLSSHFVGVDLTEHESEYQTPWVYFVSTNYKRPDLEENRYQPTFDIYPSAIENNTPLGTCFISHPLSPTITKLLLKDYFAKSYVYADQGSIDARNQTVKLTKNFTNLFKGARGEYTPDKISERDRIYLSSESHPTSWTNLNKNVRISDDPRNSIAAFVIEGAKVVSDRQRDERYLPKGILAFESSVVDGFSSKDVRVLGEMAAKLAPLIRSLYNDSSSIDYEGVLADTFLTDAQQEVGSEGLKMGHFLFQQVRIDVKSYETIVAGALSSNHTDILDLFNLSKGELIEIHENHKNILEAHDNKSVNANDLESQILVKRRANFLQNLDALRELYDRIGPRKIYQFFESCPSNFVWSAYMRSVANALADRRMSENPKLERIGAGFSAFDVYAASISGELRQVIKLSRGYKLKQERDNYRNFVRYKLPLAARIPYAGFAFDSAGSITGSPPVVNDEAEASRKATFGALVSDLIDGTSEETPQEKAKSYLEFLLSSLRYKVIRKGVDGHDPSDRENLNKLIEAVTTAVEFNFNVNFANWKKLDRVSLNASKKVINTNELPALNIKNHGFRLSSSSLEQHLNRVGSCENSKSLLSVFEALYNWQATTLKRQFVEKTALNFKTFTAFKKRLLALLEPTAAFPDMTSKVCIGHRDLNARNLAWSHYIQRLIPIDFEHVNFSVWGADQSRLIMSTVCELHTEFLLQAPKKSWSTDDENRLLIALDQVLIENAKLFVRIDKNNLAAVERSKAPKKSPHAKLIFSAIVATLKTSDIGSADDDANDTYLKYMLRSAAIKEFEYSLYSVDEILLSYLAKLVKNLSERNGSSEGVAPTLIIKALKAELKSLDHVTRVEILRKASRLIYSYCSIVTSIPMDHTWRP